MFAGTEIPIVAETSFTILYRTLSAVARRLELGAAKSAKVTAKAVHYEQAMPTQQLANQKQLVLQPLHKVALNSST